MDEEIKGHINEQNNAANPPPQQMGNFATFIAALMFVGGIALFIFGAFLFFS